MHYRRYFTNSNLFKKASNKNNKINLILSKLEIENLLKNVMLFYLKKKLLYRDYLVSL